MLNTFTLKNGIRVATYQLPTVKSIHIHAVAKGGSLVEDYKNNGVAHFMEHMLVQGIPSFPNVEEFSGFIERLAGSYGAYTDSLTVGFTITVPITYTEDAVKITSEVFFQPLFIESALEKERQVILDEINQRMDSHWFKINEFFRNTRFGKNHPLTLNPGGTPEIVKKITREDAVDYWKKYFVPKNTSLLITGNFEIKELKALLERYFGSCTGEEEFPGFPEMGSKDFSKRQVALRHDKNLSANYLDMAFPSIGLQDTFEKRLKQNLCLMILGGIRNSRLFKLLRYQRGLVYNVGCGAATWPGLGYIYISSEVLDDHLEEVVMLVAKELKAFVDNGPTKDELEMIKNFVSNQWMMAFDHPSAIAGWIENDLLWNDKVRLPEDYIEVMKDVTVEELVTLMKESWDFSKLNVTIQGPLKADKEAVKKFEKLLEELS